MINDVSAGILHQPLNYVQFSSHVTIASIVWVGPNFDAFPATHFLSKQRVNVEVVITVIVASFENKPLNKNFTVFIVVFLDGCYFRFEFGTEIISSEMEPNIPSCPGVCVFLCETLHTIAVFV